MKQQRYSGRCSIHRLQYIYICRSPGCDYYRQLCNECRQMDIEHNNYHIRLKQAIQEILKLGDNSLKQLKNIRKLKQQQFNNNITYNPGLKQINQKLDLIKIQINQKIDSFKNNIKKVYKQYIKQKLQDLQEIIEKSQQFLKKQINQLRKENYINLNYFYKHDFKYQLSYYQSYLKEILVKNIRLFKTAIENDAIFAIITNFEQNLQKIFTFSKQQTQNNIFKSSHLFTNQNGRCNLYTFQKNLNQLSCQSIASMQRISHSKPKLKDNRIYNWQGCPQSIYYQQQNCYFIIGEGKKSSTLIVKYEYIKIPDQAFTVVQYMKTQRSNFSICLLNGQIFIIGGWNKDQGCMTKCQKFVPLPNNQVYIIHSLRQRSSRHSITTYKGKYILKFGGIKKLIDQKSQQNELDLIPFPQIYSLKTQQWSIIPFNYKYQIYLQPSIFKSQKRGFILILGGNTIKQKPSQKIRPAFQLYLLENKQQIDQIKLRIKRSKIQYNQYIFNSTITLLDNDYQCCFIKNNWKNNLEIGKYKIQI